MVRALAKCKAMAEGRKKGDKISLVLVAFRLYMLMAPVTEYSAQLMYQDWLALFPQKGTAGLLEGFGLGFLLVT